MAKINWTSESENWLKDIYEYISHDSPDAATKTVTGIYEMTQSLSQFPFLGQRYEKELDREVRILLYGHYRIAYLVKENKDIDILGVFHGALDISRCSF